MFPRNIRKLYPWKVAHILGLVQPKVTAATWDGNQGLQNQFAKALEIAGLKRPGVQYDPNSGGPRTYLAQLGCLGLTFKRNQKVMFTSAGEALLNGEPPVPIIHDLLFRHQYPSEYGRSPNVKIDPNLKIRPFIFVLRLIVSLGYLTNQEFAVPVVYGHNDECFDLCVSKILKLRNGSSLAEVIDHPNDLHSSRSSKRKYEDSITDIAEIGNTCKNYLVGSKLIEQTNETGATHFVISADYYESVTAAISSAAELPFITGEGEQFQRRLGLREGSKDTRNLETHPSRDSITHQIITARFYEFAGNNPVTTFPTDFAERLVKDHGFDEVEVENTIESLLQHSLSYFETNYLNLSKGGRRTAIRFENATGKILKNSFSFSVRHTGQTQRTTGIGNYGDLFLISTGETSCGIIDTKASPSYDLPADDQRKMVSYLKSYKELVPEGMNLNLEFGSFVVGGFGINPENKLANVHKEAGIPVSGISAFTLLRTAQSGMISQKRLSDQLSNSAVIKGVNLGL